MQVAVVAQGNYSAKTAEDPAAQAEEAAPAAVPVVVVGAAEECSEGADDSAVRL